MKNKIILLVMLLSISIGMQASIKNATHTKYTTSYNKHFTFTEQGISFAIFQNGEFDFYINPRNSISFSGNVVDITFNSGYNYNAYVQYDDFGAVIQIENVPIYYDYYGRVSRIGNVPIYYRNYRAIRIGNLYIHYNRYGRYNHCTGYVNHYNRYNTQRLYYNYFTRPLFEFSIVSYKPYRNKYRPTRYKYYKNNGNNNKRYTRYNYSNNRRVATRKIPKKRNNTVSTTRRSTRANGVRYKTANNRRKATHNIRKSVKQAPIKSTKRQSVTKKRNVTKRKNQTQTATKRRAVKKVNQRKGNSKRRTRS